MKVKNLLMTTLFAAMFTIAFSSFAAAQNIVVTLTNQQGSVDPNCEN